MKTATKIGVGILVGAALGLALARQGVLEKLGASAKAPSTADAPAPAAGAPAVPAVARDTSNVVPASPQQHSPFALLAESAAPGVVNVHTSKTVTSAPFEFPFPDLFRQFFGGPFGQGPGPGQQSPEPRKFTVPSLGTGFVISEDGYIVTNNHVVADVDEIRVTFSDGREAKAKVVGQDPKTDLALIRVEGMTGLHALPLGDSDAILPGDWVIAIGNPFGLDHTVTAGIVSAKGRDIGQGPYDDYIQTDAAINPGNSGGPLLNLAGEVIGINSAINPQANTIGFAVPINLAKQILPQLKEKGSVTRGWLGVAIQPITPELAESFGLEKSEGALVAQVTPGSPADEAGVQRGDVIVRFGDEKIGKMHELPAIVSATPVGKQVQIEVIRDGKHKTFDVKIGKLEEEPTQVASEQGERKGSSAFGMRIEELTPALRKQLGIEDKEGVVVTEVAPGGPADNAGIRSGDVIVEVDRKPIHNLSELTKALDASGKRALLLVRRDGGAIYVTVDRSS